MQTVRKISDAIIYVGGDDRRTALFEGVYPIPDGVTYNSYLIVDEKTCLMDTVDKSIVELWLENLEYALGGRALDYVVVHHMEPDHSYSLMRLLEKYPDTKIVTNKKALDMIAQFFNADVSARAVVVAEGGTLPLGAHELTFTMAPMVHWPEVMMSYEKTEKVMFTADAFGTFGALGGAIFADEVDFERDYLDEARRYYANIVGKYGVQVKSVLAKAAKLDIAMLCPLHGPVWRENLGLILDKYAKWASYEPEEKGVCIIYGSIYGHTENMAMALAVKLRERGVKTRVIDSSTSHVSEIVAAAFRYDRLVFASASYNGGAFVKMEDALHDLMAHAFQNRRVAIMQNGSWAPSAANTLKKILEGAKNVELIESVVTAKSALKPEQEPELDALADELAK
ncbi:MAG: FprA family A-type flavoprotein [Oscillospiraceae bacterium]|nr:FprA family A-type flavoprotein [Oscillospiraceae bacterium]